MLAKDISYEFFSNRRRDPILSQFLGCISLEMNKASQLYCRREGVTESINKRFLAISTKGSQTSGVLV